MKIQEIIIENADLFEIQMGLGDLERAVAGINAQVGIEFEIEFPDREEYIDREVPLPDKKIPRKFDDFDFIEEFFDNLSFSNAVDDQYREWVHEQAERDFLDNQKAVLKNYFENSNKRLKQNAEKLADQAIAKRSAIYKQIKKDWISDWYDKPNETVLTNKWLETYKLKTMRDIFERFQHLSDEDEPITWPTRNSNRFFARNKFFNQVGRGFAKALGRPYKVSLEYHGAERTSKHYAIEPDASLNQGIEFVSPPLPISEITQDLEKFKSWIKTQGGITTERTGLHMNISLPEQDFSKLDYVKLAILLGDEYVLDQFGRNSNDFAKSALENIRANVSKKPNQTSKMLAQMKQGLSQIASRAIHRLSTDKYTSINIRDGWIEFRSPGGNWMDMDLKQVKATLYRFIVALDAALDPEKYRREYLSKLYKLLTQQSRGENSDAIMMFAKSAAGELDKSDLIQFLKRSQAQRTLTTAPQGKQFVWNIINKRTKSVTTSVIAASETEALNIARKMQIPVMPQVYQLEASAIYKPGAKIRYRVRDNQGKSKILSASSSLEALQRARLSNPSAFVKSNVTIEPLGEI